MRPKLETLIANLEKLTADLKPRLDELLTKAGGTLDKAGVAFDKAGVTLETTHQLLADNRENIGMMLTSFRETGYNAKHFTHTFRIIFSPWSVFCDQKKPEPGASTKAPEAQPAAGGTPAEAAKPAAANATK